MQLHAACHQHRCKDLRWLTELSRDELELRIDVDPTEIAHIPRVSPEWENIVLNNPVARTRKVVNTIRGSAQRREALLDAIKICNEQDL